MSSSRSLRSKPSRRVVRFALAGYALGVTAFHLAMLARLRRDANILPPVTLAPPLSEQENPSVATATLPRVSVIVPARDEGRSIRACVESLLAQDYPNVEVIVVDDASTDATPAILEDVLASPLACTGRLRVVRVEALPEGWAGKPHALHTGASQATGKWLLFTDADTSHAPAALRSALRRAQHDHADLFSIITAQDTPDFWGRVIIPIAAMGISMLYPPSRVNDPKSEMALANGQFLLIKREMYERVGGYANPRLRATLVDDRDLAYEVKRAGGRLELVDGRELTRTRMYQSLREHWNGWGKNADLGSPGGALLFPIMLAGLPLVSVLPFALALLGIARQRMGMALAGIVPVAAIVAYRSALNRSLAIPWRYVWTHPLGASVFTGILARSYWRGLHGRTVPWRGRSYALDKNDQSLSHRGSSLRTGSRARDR